jgi:DNA-binding transcriptional MerR regulator/effector-binding domain-containing protein
VYSIGEFSKITGLTIKAIHLYHEKGLLAPIVDESSGYRYFNQRSVDKARAIRLLKDMTFSLDEIASILQDYEDESDILGHLERKKAVIEAQLRQLKAVSLSIETILKNEREAIAMSSHPQFDIEEKSVAPLFVASYRWKGKYSDSGHAFSKLGRAVGFGMAGKPLGLYYDLEYKEDGADIESCMPIKKPVSGEGIQCRELPAGRCVTLIHKGPYDQLSRSYGRLFDYIKSKGLEAQAPIREIYVKGPGMIFKGNPKKYLTEIQIFVAERA